MVSNLLNTSLILAFQQHFWLLFRMITFNTQIKLFSLHLKTAFTTVKNILWPLVCFQTPLPCSRRCHWKRRRRISSACPTWTCPSPGSTGQPLPPRCSWEKKYYVREVFKLICGIWTSRAAKSYMKGQREAKQIWMLFITRWGVGTEFLFSSWTVTFQFRICSPTFQSVSHWNGPTVP